MVLNVCDAGPIGVGLREIKALGLCGTIIEGDCSTMVRWGLRWNWGPWELLQIILEIRDLLHDMKTSFSHVPIQHSDVLAKRRIRQSSIQGSKCQCQCRCRWKCRLGQKKTYIGNVGGVGKKYCKNHET